MFSSKLLAPLALIALMTLPGCSRAQKPAEAPAPATAPAAPPALPAEVTHSEAAATPQPATVEETVASAPHPESLPTNAPAETPPPAAPPENAPVNSGLTLHLLVPAGHAPAWLVGELEAAIGAKVAVQTYATDNERDKLMQSSPSGYDLIAVADLGASDLIGQQKLLPLPADLAPLENQPEPEFLHHYYDSKNVYTWPYGFTLLGFASAPSAPNAPNAATSPVRTWKELENLPVSLPDDGPLRAALWALAEGKPVPALNEPLPPGWQKAPYETPTATPDQPTKVWVDTISRLHPLLSRTDEHWDVVLPPEGSLITLYQWAIPAATPQPQLAEIALKALIVPARAARIDVENDLAVTQTEARKLLAPAMAADPLIYPTPRVLSQCRFVRLK